MHNQLLQGFRTGCRAPEYPVPPCPPQKTAKNGPSDRWTGLSPITSPTSVSGARYRSSSTPFLYFGEILRKAVRPVQIAVFGSFPQRTGWTRRLLVSRVL